MVYFLSQHIITIIMVVMFSMMLWTRKSFRNLETRYFWLTIISCLTLVVEDVLETMCAADPDLRFWRTLLSATGYTFRSVATLSLLLIIIPQSKRNLFLWIPSLLTLLTNCTAFFTDLAFGFDEEYAFYRGPLGYVAFIVPLFYTVLILWYTFRHIAERTGPDKYIVPVGAISCISSSVVDVFYGGNHFTQALIVSSIFFYLLLYSHDNRLDPLTGLLNRHAFYDDCASTGKNIKAVASLDMNGLKVLNDTIGHHAGDEALIKIAESITSNMKKNIAAYRVGGDEFILLFYNDNEEMIYDVKKKIKKSVEENRLSISIGYAFVNKDKDLDEAIRESDKMMYQDKEKFYKKYENDKRTR